MLPDKRKNPRRAIVYPGLIELGEDAPPCKCLLYDASEHGAQLRVGDPDSLPDEFNLVLSSDGTVRRHCRVVWRTNTQVGVIFLKDRRHSKRRSYRGDPELWNSGTAGNAAEAGQPVDTDTPT